MLNRILHQGDDGTKCLLVGFLYEIAENGSEEIFEIPAKDWNKTVSNAAIKAFASERYSET
ncbi:MAG: hypothetical protein ACMUIM_11215 [bacterium]